MSYLKKFKTLHESDNKLEFSGEQYIFIRDLLKTADIEITNLTLKAQEGNLFKLKYFNLLKTNVELANQNNKLKFRFKIMMILNVLLFIGIFLLIIRLL